MGVPEVTRDNVASYLQRVRKDEVNQSDLSMRLWKYEKEIIPTVDYYKNTEHQLPATRPRRAEEGIKEVAKFQSENLYAMEKTRTSAPISPQIAKRRSARENRCWHIKRIFATHSRRSSTSHAPIN